MPQSNDLSGSVYEFSQLLRGRQVRAAEFGQQELSGEQ